MDKITATTIFESLSSGVRLDVFRLLVKKGLDGMVAGEIATALDIPNTNLSFHLKAMTHAGLVTVQQEGRFQRYRANFPLMLETIAYLTEGAVPGIRINAQRYEVNQVALQMYCQKLINL